MARTVSVVPHTHWDREWYAPFQRFRLQLVDLLDDLLPRLEADPSFRHFLLDGQMAVVDDYLEIRPEAEATAARPGHVRSAGHGPLVHAARRVPGVGRDPGAQPAARACAGRPPSAAPWTSATCPTCSATSPRCPRSWPASASSTPSCGGACRPRSTAAAFWWEAPDGTTVRAEYLPDGYGNGARVPDDAKELLDLVDGLRQPPTTTCWPGPILWMVGTDHLTPRPWLGRVVLEANELQDDYELVIRSLAEHVADGPDRGPAPWTGELRSGARANLLMGVASNRIDVKQAAARAERALERVAEPLAALFQPADDWPRRCSTSPGWRSSATPPTTRSAAARTTRWSTPSSTATPRPATSAEA